MENVLFKIEYIYNIFIVVKKNIECNDLVCLFLPLSLHPHTSCEDYTLKIGCQSVVQRLVKQLFSYFILHFLL